MAHSVKEMLTLKTNKKPKHITITMKNQEENIQEIWDNIKRQNLCIIGAEGGESKVKRAEMFSTKL